MKVRFSRPAARQLDEVLAYIADCNPIGAQHVQARLMELISLSRLYPFAGIETTRRGERRLLASPYPYAVTYRIDGDEIVILGIRHTARRPR